MKVYLKKSNKSGKKFMVLVDGKTIHFGQAGASDFTIHKDKDRMMLYVGRHKSRENWTKSGIKTAGFWSRWLLWNKPSLAASKRDIASRFGISFSSSSSNDVKKSKSRKSTSRKKRSPSRNKRSSASKSPSRKKRSSPHKSKSRDRRSSRGSKK